MGPKGQLRQHTTELFWRRVTQKYEQYPIRGKFGIRMWSSQGQSGEIGILISFLLSLSDCTTTAVKCSSDPGTVYAMTPLLRYARLSS
jgi:hypothetical protein